MVEPQIVVLVVAGSSPVGHPKPVSVSQIPFRAILGLESVHPARPGPDARGLAKPNRTLVVTTASRKHFGRRGIASALHHGIGAKKNYRSVIFFIATIITHL
jgi:hypothetical protein